MNSKDFNWRTALTQIFSASVNQQTLEEAAELMVAVSSYDHTYHEECLVSLDEAINAAKNGDRFVIECINKSGYKVSEVDQGLTLLKDFRSIYLENFNRVQ